MTNSPPPPDVLWPPTLQDLVAHLHRAARDVRGLRAGTVDRDRLAAARDVLLDAMERYARELDERRLPVPPKLRDDLRLQRELRSRPPRSR